MAGGLGVRNVVLALVLALAQCQNSKVWHYAEFVFRKQSQNFRVRVNRLNHSATLSLFDRDRIRTCAAYAN